MPDPETHDRMDSPDASDVPTPETEQALPERARGREKRESTMRMDFVQAHREPDFKESVRKRREEQEHLWHEWRERTHENLQEASPMLTEQENAVLDALDRVERANQTKVKHPLTTSIEASLAELQKFKEASLATLSPLDLLTAITRIRGRLGLVENPRNPDARQGSIIAAQVNPDIALALQGMQTLLLTYERSAHVGGRIPDYAKARLRPKRPGMEHMDRRVRNIAKVGLGLVFGSGLVLATVLTALTEVPKGQKKDWTLVGIWGAMTALALKGNKLGETKLQGYQQTLSQHFRPGGTYDVLDAKYGLTNETKREHWANLILNMREQKGKVSTYLQTRRAEVEKTGTADAENESAFLKDLDVKDDKIRTDIIAMLKKHDAIAKNKQEKESDFIRLLSLASVTDPHAQNTIDAAIRNGVNKNTLPQFIDSIKEDVPETPEA